MTFTRFRRISSRTLVLPQENIDTDQIIPARFLAGGDPRDLGSKAFYDWRYDPDGNRIDGSPINGFTLTDHCFIVAGNNFGCGSSREHAVWALLAAGFRAVISTSIADIFASNALENGFLPVHVDTDTHARLLDSPGQSVTIDLREQLLLINAIDRIRFEIDPFARHCLLDGGDSLDHLIKRLDKIARFEQVTNR